ncbi:hypothetical protein D7V97_32665 [Corallococcus sp. CA053C]|uniref:hypothetical protein n=1 Tax=Corallococcus sp. CA053C TaxID=2316732 RepID=UPI000EA2ED54|nr:hypothetical protein [Corallococcus sp. CA053C]RKG98659.1 hypothetical protein D7V97_32665 [Corallococcus sp. CA053C]
MGPRDSVAQLALELAPRIAEETATALVDLANVLEREAVSVDAPPRVPNFPESHAHRWARLLLSCHTMSAALRQPLDSARSVTRFNTLIALANAIQDVTPCTCAAPGDSFAAVPGGPLPELPL